jgi:hypothetical protein
MPDVNIRELLVAVIASDGAELQQVSTEAFLTVEDLEAVFAAAPRLQVLNASLMGEGMELLPFLRNDPPYGPMRASQVDVHSVVHVAEEVLADVLALAAAVASHESLKCLNLLQVHFVRGLNALVDAAAELRVSQLCVDGYSCSLDAETPSALTRLLQHGSLTTLKVSNADFGDAPEKSLLELCAALRSCHTLTHLVLGLHPPLGISSRVVTELLGAVGSLPALSVLNLSDSLVQDTTAFGHALGALLGANLPSLHTLHVNFCLLGDEGLAPLLDGLAANTHLRELDCHGNNLSEAFKRDRLWLALAALAARRRRDAQRAV